MCAIFILVKRRNNEILKVKSQQFDNPGSFVTGIV
jgi:hypothetical protein